MRDIEPYTFLKAASEWEKPPVDNVGYIPAYALRNLPDKILMDIMDHAASERYALDGWRNKGNKWRELLGLDTTNGKCIMDFGCGIGIEAREFAKSGNHMILADIVQNNIMLAQRVLELDGYASLVTMVNEEAPFFSVPPIDIFYANGVLHHTPLFREILQCAVAALAPGGEVRLMLYSDKGWTFATDTPPPPIEANVCDHESFAVFVRKFDGVGHYANWFNREKIEYLVGDFLTVERCDYICDNDRYLVATLKPKEEADGEA